MVIPPRYRVSDVIEMLKKNTSRHLKEKYAHFLKKIYWDGGGIWSKGYFVSTAGINEHIINQYVLYQGHEDVEQAQLEL